ncbi:MAG: IS1595 family transposase [Patescibacteria group bacterium]|nr:IS1595 family transposase [Patescibacteria group bacterium]MDE1944135.1 IS1595 family transposase [Patescibacteria group bacterium]MDE1944756.1 IS1595 family transposase [Patescibacteria group bacterium]MDE2057958.1 IS1595 family transposase [Patescibacteria group bacterium]
MKYTIKSLKAEFPTDIHCLDHIFKTKYPTASGYHKIAGRKAYANNKGHHIHPLAGTIFEKSSTSLTIWFHVIFLFATSKNGVSAMEIQRQTGVTYKTAWRMGHQIRKLMEQDKNPLTGEVEADETFYGKGGTHATKFKNKQAVLGAVERKGRIKVKAVPNRQAAIVLPFIKENVVRGSKVVTDEYRGYDKLSYSAYGYTHRNVKHGKHHMLWKGEHTNTIEGFWGQFKKSVRGTYAFVSPQHLQAYLNEFAWRYNERTSSVPLFQLLALKAAQ